MDEELRELLEQAKEEETNAGQEENETNDNDNNGEQSSNNGVNEEAEKSTEAGENDGGESSDEGNAESENDTEDDEHSKENNGQEKETNAGGIIEVEVDGIKLDFKDKNELQSFIQRQIGKKDEKLPSKIEQITSAKELTEEDLLLLAEVKKGNPKAIAYLAKKSGLDIEEIEADDANDFEGVEDFKEMDEVEQIAYKVYNDENQREAFQETIKGLPEDFVSNVVGDASNFRNFMEQVNNGLAKEIIPEAKKHSLLTGKNFFDSYAEIGQKIFNEKNSKDNKNERKISEKEKELRNKAKKNTDNSNKKNNAETPDDIFNMSDEEFEEYKRNRS